MQSMIDNFLSIEIIKEILITECPGYQVGSLIGKGGQKLVYDIVDLNNGDKRVIKLIKSSTDSDERLKREILAVNEIDHNHIPKIFKTNIYTRKKETDPVWIIEEFINGSSLRESLNNKKVFEITEIIQFMDTMFSILEVSESKNIIHRDIKPENIIIDTNNKFWLIDFGISRHLDLESITSSNSPYGPCTFGYSAAEQFRNRKKDIDIRTDLFSLGVVASEMISGKNPYLKDVKGILELIKKIENTPLPLLRIKGDKQYFLAKFIKILGDNRLTRRPRSIIEAKNIFKLVKDSI